MIYYGNGKGKTSAVVGLAVRAAGAGLNVFFLQFVKGEWPCSEREYLSDRRQETSGRVQATSDKRQETRDKARLGIIDFHQCGKGFVKILGDKKPLAVHKKAALDGLRMARAAMLSGKYEVVILDEAISAYESKLLKVSNLVKLVKEKPANVHLALTGHVAPRALVAKSDLVSEVKMIKHPYYKGVLARRGIDY